MELLETSRSLVLAIDFQGKLMERVYRPELLRQGAERLLRFASLFQVPLLLTEQYPKGIGPTHPSIRAAYDVHRGPKRFLEKSCFSCCESPEFEPAVRSLLPGVLPEDRQFILCGIEAHVCVLQTALHILRQGSQVILCWEAISGRGEEHVRYGMERMVQCGASRASLESVGFEWAQHKDHVAFKEMSAVLKEGQIGS